jgi:bidirectional [NiFe] hydrogenase diaphorase subunit
MHEILSSLTKGEAHRQDLELLEELCDVVQATSLCGLGQTAPNPVLSTLRFFRDEYEQKLAEATQ